MVFLWGEIPLILPYSKSVFLRWSKWTSRAGDHWSISEQVGNDCNALLSSNVFPAYLLQYLIFSSAWNVFLIYFLGGCLPPNPQGAEGKGNIRHYKSVIYKYCFDCSYRQRVSLTFLDVGRILIFSL